MALTSSMPASWRLLSTKLLPNIRLPTSSFRALSSTTPSSEQDATSVVNKSDAPVAKKKTSLAMKYYLEKKRNHDAFIARERSEFELGKKHLANMMGMEVEEMTQKDIDQAIAYLFPSGLQTLSARPLMKPPEEIFPRQKEPEFDYDGRPHHPFFYTGTPNFVQVLYDVVESLESCILLTDRLYSQGKVPDSDQMLNDTQLAGTRWLNKSELESRLLEKITDAQYNELIEVLERLVFQHFSYKFKDFIFGYRTEATQLTSKKDFITPEFDEKGRAYVEAIGRRRTSCAKVRVTKPGTGKFSLIHIDYPDYPQDINYFYGYRERHQVLFPLQFSKLLGLVDVDCIVDNGGATSQAGAIRYALALCLKSFVDVEMCEDMTITGLLTQNIRVRERKKPGRDGARRRFAWRKR